MNKFAVIFFIAYFSVAKLSAVPRSPQSLIFSDPNGNYLLIQENMLGWGTINGIHLLPIYSVEQYEGSREVIIRYVEPTLRAINTLTFDNNTATIIGPQLSDNSEYGHVLTRVRGTYYDKLSQKLQAGTIPLMKYSFHRFKTIFVLRGTIDRLFYVEVDRGPWGIHSKLALAHDGGVFHRIERAFVFDFEDSYLFRFRDPEHGYMTLEIHDSGYSPTKGRDGSLTGKVVIEERGIDLMTITVPHLFDDKVMNHLPPITPEPLDSPYDLFNPLNCEQSLRAVTPPQTFH